MTNNPIKIFDGHSDFLFKLWSKGKQSIPSFITGQEDGHIDLSKAKQGGLIGGLCAIFPPSLDNVADKNGIMPELSHQEAIISTLAMADILQEIENQAPDRFKICRSVIDIKDAIDKNKFAAVFHIEGAEAISENLEQLPMLYERGLRSIGPVWSRPNWFAFGVPFRFPSNPDIGDGLTDAGKNLIRACDKMRIMIDLSHMNEKGFWDTAKISQAPLVASHSNAHILSPQSRNLTNQQLLAIRDSDGLVGINFGVKFLRADGERNQNTPLDTIVDHICYIIDKVGIDHVGFGSDFDGTTLPQDLYNCSALPALIETMRKRGFTQTDINKVAIENWLITLDRIWGQ